ncbi:MAG: SurA N-terminal domain-containing protein [Candidatus Omnitrophica bacterium]|nr:SurA N-terminal domain-containing protein [Candidatus Omnitrophota bacterium]
MPKNIHQKKIKRFWIIIILFILPGFILWGSEVLLQHLDSQNYAGIVFGKKITLDKFRMALLAVRNQLLLQKGEEFLKQEKDIDLSPQAWDRIILLMEAKRRKIKVSDEEVKKFIQTLPIFWRGNKFNFDTYQDIVRYLLKTELRLFEEEIREDLILSKLYDQITANIQLTDEEIRVAYRRENEMISVEYLSISLKELEEKVVWDKEKLYQYYLNNRDKFKIPTSFNLQYIIEADSEKAKKLYHTLRKTKDFAKYLSSHGYRVNETGYFHLDEPIPGIEWSSYLSFLIERLKVGEISPPIKIKNSYLLLYLKQKRHPYIPRFEEINEKIKEAYIQEETKKLARDILESVLSEIKMARENNTKIDFPEFARRYNLKFGNTELFKRSTYIPQIGASDKFFVNFKELTKGSMSAAIIEMEQAFFIARITDYRPIDEESFKREKEEFRRTLNIKVKDIRFVEFLWQLREKAKLKILL